MMKKLFLVLTVVLGLAVAQGQTTQLNKKETSIQIDKLYGTWEWYLLKSGSEEIKPEAIIKMTFKNNNKYDFYYKYKNTAPQTGNFSYSINGNKITFPDNIEKERICSIIELTNQKLVLQNANGEYNFYKKIFK